MDWTIFTGFIVIATMVYYTQVLRVQANEEIKRVTKIGTCQSDIEYKGKSLVKLFLASIAGGLCSAIGLGGGVAFNPVLIGMGVSPQVSASTGMYMIMFSAFSNALTFWLFGNLYTVYALWIGFWSGIGIYLFLSVFSALIKKYKHPSIIVFCLAGVIALSALVAPAVNTQHLLSATKQGQNVWAFGQLC